MAELTFAMSITYEPLNTLKPLAENVWLVDGPMIRFYGLPFSTRMTVVRLENGDIWIHSPTQLTPELASEIESLGPVRHLIAPNWIHYAYVNDWQLRFDDAVSYGAPGVAERAASRNIPITIDIELSQGAEPPWGGQIAQMIVEGSKVHREAVFFHNASKTLILTDLIENIEARKLPFWMRPLAWLGGVTAPHGKMPADMRFSFRGNEILLRGAVERMIGWGPERIVLAHGQIIKSDPIGHLRRAFASVL